MSAAARHRGSHGGDHSTSVSFQADADVAGARGYSNDRASDPFTATGRGGDGNYDRSAADAVDRDHAADGRGRDSNGDAGVSTGAGANAGAASNAVEGNVGATANSTAAGVGVGNRRSQAISGGVGASVASTHLLDDDFRIQGPLKGQPRARTEPDSTPVLKWITMTLLFIIGLFVIVSLFVLCLFEDQCLRQDAGVMAEGAAAVFPLAAILLFIVTPVGFTSVFYERVAPVVFFSVLGILSAIALFVCAIVSWVNVQAANAESHASTAWSVMSAREKAWYNDDMGTLQASYEHSATVYGVFAFVTSILLFLAVVSTGCFWFTTDSTREQCCGSTNTMTARARRR